MLLLLHSPILKHLMVSHSLQPAWLSCSHLAYQNAICVQIHIQDSAKELPPLKLSSQSHQTSQTHQRHRFLQHSSSWSNT